jgi:hypothetical protein
LTDRQAENEQNRHKNIKTDRQKTERFKTDIQLERNT